MTNISVDSAPEIRGRYISSTCNGADGSVAPPTLDMFLGEPRRHQREILLLHAPEQHPPTVRLRDGT
jgi:hypothetical protein